MKILLATDGSKDAVHAAKFLSRLPHREPLELTVVTTIVFPHLHPADASTTWPPELWDQIKTSAQSALDEITPMFQGADVTLTEKIIEGHTGHCIVEEAKSIGADLIVLGAKGHSAVGRVLLGSVSDFVATQAPCSVMVVRPSMARDDAPEFTVTVGYDGSSGGETALKQYNQFEWGPATKTEVLTVVPIVRFFGKDVLPESVSRRTEQHEIATQATAAAASKIAGSGAKVDSHIVEAEHIGEQIVQFAKDQRSDLVIVGDTGLSAISRMLLGSVSRYVLRHADCGVWIAR